MVLVEEGDCFLAAEEMDNFLLSVCEREGGTGESFWVGEQGNWKEGNSFEGVLTNPGKESGGHHDVVAANGEQCADQEPWDDCSH